MAHAYSQKSGPSKKSAYFKPRSSTSQIAILILLISNQILAVLTCPKDCFCGPHTKNVQCANKNYQMIPVDIIPEDTLELNLNENSFRNADLTRRNFTKLRQLSRLFMSDCGIETIAVDTFADLDNLSWLDISKNKIRFIADFTFRGLHLKHLFINDNIGIQFSVGAFAGLTTQGLYLHNCGLRKLPVDLMSPLNGSLKTLWIHMNNFEGFSHKWLYVFKTLAHVRLGGNAFHCNCEIQWLYRFFQESKISLFAAEDDPKCASPAPVAGKSFQELTEADFRCDLPTFKNLDAVFDSKMGKLTCEAMGDPAPTLYWSRPDGTTETFYPDEKDHENKANSGILFLTDMKLDSKDAYKCVASNPAGNVTFALNIVWPDLKPTVVTKPPIDNSNNIINADVTVSSSNNDNNNSGNRRVFKNFAGDDSGVYNWDHVNSESSKMSNGDGSGGSGGSGNGGGVGNHRVKLGGEDDSHHFTIIDIVGAVVGTFILTLLICITAFHYYQKRREQQFSEAEHHYSVPTEVNNKRTPNDVFIMNETDDNRIKMINHSMEFPS